MAGRYVDSVKFKYGMLRDRTGKDLVIDGVTHKSTVLLCAVKTLEGDFRFWWTISPNVGQTHKENPNFEFFI